MNHKIISFYQSHQDTFHLGMGGILGTVYHVSFGDVVHAALHNLSAWSTIGGGAVVMWLVPKLLDVLRERWGWLNRLLQKKKDMGDDFVS